MFSVVIPLYNKELSIKKTIQSVLDQSFQSFELLIINDGSTDASVTIVDSFSDSRINLIHQENKGVSAARNKGIEEAKHEWICFLDADDLWHKNHLSEKIRVIKENDSVEVLTCRWINDKAGAQYENDSFVFNQELVTFTLTDFLNINSFVWTGAVTIRKSLLQRVGVFPENCNRGEDFDTWIRCLFESKESLFINKILATYRRDTENNLTNRISNPILNICMVPTLNKIRVQTEDQKLLKAIDLFLFKKVYEILKGTKLSKVERNSYIRQIKSYSLRKKLSLKLLLRRILVKLGLLERLK